MRRAIRLWCIALVPILVIVALLVVKRLHGPLVDAEDTNQYEYCGFYLGEHLHWSPLPWMELHTTDVFYPYGTNAVFQPWVLERDLLYVVLTHFFGAGPWLALHMLASFAIAALGSAILTHRDFGFARASFIGFVAGFASYYAVHKYPLQISLCPTHWTTLGIVCDFVLLHRAWKPDDDGRGGRRSLGAHLVCLRVVLLFLALGQELGYVAGLSFTSFVLTFPVALFLARRNGLLRVSALRGGLRELATKRALTAALLVLFAIGGLLYFPLTLGIVKAARELGNVPAGGSWWAHPARLLDPWLPFVHPGSPAARVVFGQPEGIGEGSPGLFFVVIALVGVAFAVRRRELWPVLPLVVFFLLAIPFHPAWFPTLKIFPWFTFHRVGGRTTLAYPIACALLALRVPWRDLRIKSPRLVAALAMLGVAELTTAYVTQARAYEPAHVDERFDAFMKTVRETPGEAVLDWPFCVAGGNGVGSRELCPYYFRNNTIFANQRFHRKKVMGDYFGRLAESQVEPYRRAGWPALFHPEPPGFPHSARQAVCFTPEEWEFFDAFLAAHDFAGIDVYVDILAPGCAEKMYERYGLPIAETVFVGAGRVTFVPKRRRPTTASMH
jgi:hypothetical protein